MKILVMLSFIGFGIFFGLKGGIAKAKPKWWMIFAIIWVAFASIISIIPPLGGNFAEARNVAHIEERKNVLVSIIPIEESFEFQEKGYWTFQATYPTHLFEKTENEKQQKYDLVFDGNDLPSEFKSGKELIVSLFYIQHVDKYFVNKIEVVDPFLVFPYVPALEERIRNLNFHVPMHWIAVIAFMISMIFSIKYLKNQDYKDDIKAYSAIMVGLFFTVLGTTTGMIWAKFNWGSFWNNDPRQITILVIMIIYTAYLLLRSSIDDPVKKSKLSSVYSIISFSTVPFLFFIIPRQFASLHPGAKDDGTTGPVIDTQGGMLDSELALAYYISLAGFIIIFFWLYSLFVRYNIIKETINMDTYE